MKSINKYKAEPIEFSDWKAQNPNATYRDLRGAAKEALKVSLIQEQKGICCYCECRITQGTSHIEHFKPKDLTQYPELQLEYSNLHASCQKLNDSNPDKHCGHKKDNDYLPTLISPLEPDCATHFSYEYDGTILGTDDRGSEAITMLNLSSELLNQQRESLIDYFLELSKEKLAEELSFHLDENRADLGEFYTMVASLQF